MNSCAAARAVGAAQPSGAWVLLCQNCSSGLKSGEMKTCAAACAVRAAPMLIQLISSSHLA